METTLHRQLKTFYCPDESLHEVKLGRYKIDAILDDRLIEIQCSSLGAIRDKIRDLLKSHHLLVVKPIAARTYLIKRKHSKIISQRYSPLKKTIYHLFDDLVHFVPLFPHPRLTLEIPLVELEEHRRPAKRKRWKRKDYRVEDRLLREVHERITLKTTNDLKKLLPKSLPKEFTTADLATHTEIPRWLAQKMAYCLRETATIRIEGKQGNAIVYAINKGKKRLKAA